MILFCLSTCSKKIQLYAQSRNQLLKGLTQLSPGSGPRSRGAVCVSAAFLQFTLLQNDVIIQQKDNTLGNE